MALSGSVKTNDYNGRYYELTWTATQSVADNKSKIAWTLKAIGGSSSWYAERTLYLQISDKVVIDKTDRVERKAGVVSSGTIDVAHDSDGEAYFGVNLQVAVYGYDVNCVAYTGFDLNTIARATVPSVDKTSIDFGSSVVISLPRKASSFKHSLKYTFDGVSNTFATNVDTSYTWTIPLDFMNRIPNATSGVITISCLTYSGSTLVGTKTVNVTATVPSNIVPKIKSVSVVEATPGIKDKFGVFLMDQSSFNVKIDAEGAYGSTIATYATNFVGALYNGSEFKVNPVSSIGNQVFLVTVKDSRGRTASYEYTINVVEYLGPRIMTFNAFRCDEDGNQDDEGEYIYIEYGHSISSINNKNDKEYKLQIKTSTATSYSTITSGNDYFYEDYTIIEAGVDDSYTIKYTVKDYFTTITREIEAPTGFTLVDYHSTGKGIAFGKVSERAGAMEINFTMYDKYDTLIGNGIASYAGAGAINSDTTLETVFISSTNTPDDGLWNISQIFYQEKSAEANRMQYAVPYAYDNGKGNMVGQNRSHYRRNFVAGWGWTEWFEIPVIIESGTSGVWTYEKWSNRKARIEGRIPVSSVAVQTALGTWYRSGQIYSSNDYSYPLLFAEDPTVNANFFTSNTNGALIWWLNGGNAMVPPTCYLIRPVTSEGVSGYVHMIVEGTY